MYEVNSPTSVLFTKGKLLYGLDLAKQAIESADRAVIVEGYFDVISLYDNGVKNVVASMGTAISLDQLRLAAEATTTDKTRTADSDSVTEDKPVHEIVLLLDGDSAGQMAISRVCSQVHDLNTTHIFLFLSRLCIYSLIYVYCYIVDIY